MTGTILNIDLDKTVQCGIVRPPHYMTCLVFCAAIKRRAGPFAANDSSTSLNNKLLTYLQMNECLLASTNTCCEEHLRVFDLSKRASRLNSPLGMIIGCCTWCINDIGRVTRLPSKVRRYGTSGNAILVSFGLALQGVYHGTGHT